MEKETTLKGSSPSCSSTSATQKNQERGRQNTSDGSSPSTDKTGTAPNRSSPSIDKIGTTLNGSSPSTDTIGTTPNGSSPSTDTIGTTLNGSNPSTDTIGTTPNGSSPSTDTIGTTPNGSSPSTDTIGTTPNNRKRMRPDGSSSSKKKRRRTGNTPNGSSPSYSRRSTSAPPADDSEEIISEGGKCITKMVDSEELKDVSRAARKEIDLLLMKIDIDKLESWVKQGTLYETDRYRLDYQGTCGVDIKFGNLQIQIGGAKEKLNSREEKTSVACALIQLSHLFGRDWIKRALTESLNCRKNCRLQYKTGPTTPPK